MTRWDYRVIERSEELDNMGDIGWELVAVVPIGLTPQSNAVRMYFKRPKPNQAVSKGEAPQNVLDINYGIRRPKPGGDNASPDNAP